MTGVRVRSAVDRSILSLSSRLPEVAAGFSIGSTHATQRVARRFTWPRPPSFQDKRSGACCRRGSSFRFCTARGRCRWCARTRLPCHSFDHQIHARRGRAPSSASYWRLLRLTEFAIAIGPAMNAALQAAPSELFLAVVAQPITGIALAWYVGYSLTDGWIVLSILLYIVIGCFWLPVVWIQLRMRDLAEAAASKGLTSTGLSPPVLGLVRVRLPRVCGHPRHPVADDHAAGLPLLPIGNVSAHFRRERLPGDCLRRFGHLD